MFWSRASLGLFVAPLALLSGCTCGGAKTTSADAGVSTAPTVASSASSGGAAGKAPALSAPIGAAVIPGSHGAVLVAGLAASRGAVVLTRVERDGRIAFSRDVLDHVGWAPDAALDVFASSNGSAFVLFRGLAGGKPTRLLASVDPAGATRGAAEKTSGGACATEDGLAWVGRDHGFSVFRRGWADPSSHAELSLKSDDGDVLFACGTHKVFPLVEGEGTVSLARAGADGGHAASLVVAQAPSGGEMHDHVEYTEGDDFGVVLPDGSGAVAFRELRGETLGPWRRLHARVSGDGALVAADADDTSVYVVTTREDAGASCPDGAARQRLVVTRASRSGAETETESESASDPLECGADGGPFWTGMKKGALVVAWGQRKAEGADAPDREARRGAPPFTGVAFVRAAKDGALGIERVASPADALVDAGCDDDACYAAALARPEGTDGMVPGPVKIVRYGG